MKRIILPLLSVLVFSACNDAKPVAKTGAMPSLVNVSVLQPGRHMAYYEYPGTTSSAKDVILVSKASGEVKKIYAKDGDLVKQGDLLVLIDDDMAKAQTSAAYADLAAAKAEEANAQAELKRAQALKASTSKKELDLKQAAYSRAKAGVQKAQAALKIAQINEKHTKIIAPFSGKLGQFNINEGDFVNASTSKIVRLSDASNLRVQFFIPDSDRQKLSALKPHQSASFTYGGEEFKGELSFIDSNNELASIKAYASFQTDKIALASFVKLRLDDIAQDDVYKINKANLLQDVNGFYVYLKRQQKAVQVHVKPIFEDEKYALIRANTSDIKPGDELILDNYKKIHPGSLVATDAEFGAMMAAAKKAK